MLPRHLYNEKVAMIASSGVMSIFSPLKLHLPPANSLNTIWSPIENLLSSLIATTSPYTVFITYGLQTYNPKASASVRNISFRIIHPFVGFILDILYPVSTGAQLGLIPGRNFGISIYSPFHSLNIRIQFFRGNF